MNNQANHLQKSLSLRHLVLFGLAFMAPITVFATYGVAIEMTQGMLPTAYLISFAIMFVTAYSYGKLVSEFPIAGSSYSFTQKGLSPHAGFLVGWVILLDYVFSPMISGLLVGIFGNSYFPSIPVYIWVIVFIAIITTVNVLGIKIAATFNTLMVLFQVLFCLLFVGISIQGLMNGLGTGTLFSAMPFLDPNVNFASILTVVPILCFSFLGFDAVTTLSEETKNPKVDLPKAIIAITTIGGILFTVVTYFAYLVYPDFNKFSSIDSAALDILTYIGGSFLSSFFLAVTIVSGFASAVASGASASRILFVMGRDGVLPTRFFGHISPKYRTPVYNILLIGVIALSAVYMDIGKATSYINFGAFFAFTFVNLAVIRYFYIRKKERSFKGTIFNFIVPLLGAFFSFFFLTKLDMHALLFGGSWLMVGFIYLLYFTKFFRQSPPELHFEEENGPIHRESLIVSE